MKNDSWSIFQILTWGSAALREPLGLHPTLEWSLMKLILNSDCTQGSLTLPGTFQEPSLLPSWLTCSLQGGLSLKAQISAGLLAATQSLLISPSPPPFLSSFTIWSVPHLLSQPSSSVPWIFFFLPAFVSVAGTLRMVLVTLSKVTWRSGTSQ